MLKTKKGRGFTLIELMIVIAILSILVIALLPNLMAARAASKLSACQSNLKNIATALETYFVDYEKYPTTDFTVDQSSPLWQYILKNLTCPECKLEYEYKSMPPKYQIYCPTMNSTTTKKHRTQRGIVTRIYFDPDKAVVIEY